MKKMFILFTAILIGNAVVAQTKKTAGITKTKKGLVTTSPKPAEPAQQPKAAEVASQTKKADDVAKFASETVDLGNVKKGNPVTASFTLTNISKEDLIIENVTPGCGCTKSDYTKEPIKPGKTGTITATYNAANAGNFNKSVSVKFAGIQETKSISIVGVVKE